MAEAFFNDVGKD